MRVSKTLHIGYLQSVASVQRSQLAAERKQGDNPQGERVSLSPEVFLRYLERALVEAFEPEIRALSGQAAPAGLHGWESGPPFVQHLWRTLTGLYPKYRQERSHLTEHESLAAFQHELGGAIERAFRAALEGLAAQGVLDHVTAAADEMLGELLRRVGALSRLAA